MDKKWQKVKKILNKDGVVVIPTDTLYGLVGKALSKKAVKNIYKLKERNLNKPLIVLINSLQDLDIFGIKVGEKQAKILKEFWPAKISIILPCKNKKFFYLHRGINSIAFRMIGKRNKNLFNLISRVGPLVAPSANVENLPPAYTITEAKKYFGSKVDYYLNAGKRNFLFSTLVKMNYSGEIKILRRGSIKLI